MKKLILLTLALFVLSTSAVFAQTEEKAKELPELKLDETQKELKKGLEEAFELFETIDLNEMFKELDIDSVFGGLQDQMGKDNDTDSPNISKLFKIIDLSELMNQMDLDSNMEQLDEMLKSEDFKGQLQDGMSLLQNMDLAPLQKMMESMMGEMKNLDLDQVLPSDKKKRKI